MGRYYEFAGDTLLTEEADALLQTPSDYFADMYHGIVNVAEYFGTPLGDASRERLFRVISWIRFADELLDVPYNFKLHHEAYEDSVAALAPAEWRTQSGACQVRS